MRALHFLLIIPLLSNCTGKDPVKVKENLQLLILSGRNNHEWQKTTPVLLKMYRESRRFTVEVTERPDTLSGEHISSFDAVVSNWSAWPEHDYRWPKAAEDGLREFIEQGGGFVLLHAASATFYDWSEYQEMAGTTWGDSTTHGSVVPHKVVIVDKEHPITDGIADFWITDELWVNAGVNANLNILAASYSNPDNKGRGEMEPVVHWTTKAKGRIFHNILGHNERALKNTGLKTLMLRGTEWAATGKVTIPAPLSLSEALIDGNESYSWAESDTTLSLLNHGQILWQYNYKTIDGKPFFHPINVDNTTITWLNPEDHPWHLGIWHSWKFVNNVNYWEYDRSENVAPFNFLGVTEVREIKIEKNPDFSCDISLDIFYHENDGPDLLQEERTIRASSPGKDGLFHIDYTFDFKALAEEVELDRTPLPHQENGKDWGGYAGLSVRFSQDCYQPEFINSDGSTAMKHGEPMSWRYYGLKNIRGNDIGVTIFTSPKNLNAPEPWFMTDYEDHPFYYFSPAPIFNQPHVMKKGDKLKLKYRIQFYGDSTTKVDLDEDYHNYLQIN